MRIRLFTQNIPLATLLLLLLTGSAVAQQATTVGKWRPTVLAETGAIAGGFEPAAEWRMSGGLRRGSWMAGLGAGMDMYRFTTVPIVATGSYALGQRRHKPFVQASLGVNLPALRDGEKRTFNNWWLIDPIIGPGPWPRPGGNLDIPVSYGAGYYADMALGYRFAVGKNHALQAAFVYSSKSLKESYPTTAFGGNGEQTDYTEKRTYYMQRIGLRVGFIW